MNDKTILVVDDERNIGLVLSQVLESVGLPVKVVTSGQAAVAELADPSIHIMLLDIRMPGMDGLEVLRRTRQSRQDIKVIMMTAYGTIDLAVEAMKAGAADFIQKPFKPQEIRDMVARCLAAEGAQDEEYHALVDQAKSHIGHREYDAAAALLHRAIDLNPDRPQAYNLMGSVLQKQGEEAEAATFFQAALAVKSGEHEDEENLDPQFIY